MGLGIVGTKRLMDNFEITSSPAGTLVKMGKDLPVAAPVLTPMRLKDVTRQNQQQDAGEPL